MEQQKNLYKRIFNSLEKAYERKRKVYQDIRDLLAPGTGLFTHDTTSSDNLENENINYKKLLDSEPITFLDTTTAGLYGGLINPASRWFDLTIDKMDREYQQYDIHDIHSLLDANKEGLYFLFAKTNFYSAMKSVISEWVRYGIGVMLIEEKDWDLLFFNPLTVGEYYLGINEYGEYTKLARKFRKTADQLVADFGIENLPEKVVNAYENGDYEKDFEVCHLICENPKDGVVLNKFKFVDLYWMDGCGQKYLRASGFMSNPIVAFSWDRKNLRTIYPMGLCEKMLGDVNELQFTVKSLNINKSYLANPALALHTSLGKKPILPGARFYTDQDPAKVASEIYRVQSHIAELEDSRARLLDKIRKMSYSEILMLFAGKDRGTMTAREVTAIVNEQMTLLAPIYLQAKSGLDAIFARVMDICIRRKIFMYPEGIDPKDIKIEFLSSISKAQRLAEVGSIQDLIMYVAQLAQVKPSALDFIDEDAIVIDLAERLGNGSKIRSAEEVAQMRQAQAAAQAQMQDLERRREEMKIAKDASKARLDPASVLGQQQLQEQGELPPEAYGSGGGF